MLVCLQIYIKYTSGNIRSRGNHFLHVFENLENHNKYVCMCFMNEYIIAVDGGGGYVCLYFSRFLDLVGRFKYHFRSQRVEIHLWVYFQIGRVRSNVHA